MLLGIGDSDMDLDVDMDVDLDAGLDLDTDAGGAGDLLSSFLSIRTIVFAVAFFGITGLLLPLAGAGDAVTLLGSVGVGLVAGFTNDRLFRYLKRTESDSGIAERDLAGSPATVQLPVDAATRGTVVVQRDGRTIRMVAEPFDAVRDSFSQREEVVVVEVRDGVARIAPLDLSN